MQKPSTKAPEPMDIALGGAVRRRRRDVGLSQEALAEQCNVSFQQIQKYENGVNRISFSRLVQISRALQCGLVDLLSVLDTPQHEVAGGGEFLTALRTPGAKDLLTAFDQLSLESRSSLVTFMRTLADGRGRRASLAEAAQTAD